MATIVFHVQDPAGHPVGGALLSSVGGPGPWQGLTGADGNFVAELSPAHYDITFTHPSWRTRVLPADLADSGTVTVGLDAPSTQGDGMQVTASGFLDANGLPWTWAMVDGWRDLERLVWGEEDQVRACLAETVELGGTGRHVLGMMDPAGFQEEHQSGEPINGLHPQDHPDYFDKFGLLCDLYAEYALAMQFCVFADTKLLLPHLPDQLAHAERIYGIARTKRNLFLKLVNENDANDNGIDLAAFAKPAGVCFSFGSNGTGNNPPLPAGDYADLGSERRGDFALSTTTAYYARHGYAGESGNPGFAGTQVLTVVSEPPGFDENMQPGRRTNDPEVAYLLGRGCRWGGKGGGGTAHSTAGLQSQLLPPRTKECVCAMILGVKAT